jgi:large subunit ribosomal protein L29
MNISELRDMSDEQLGLTLQETCENLFRLRLQAQTERLDAPSELQKQRRAIAQIKTIQRQRSGPAGRDAPTGAGPMSAGKTSADKTSAGKTSAGKMSAVSAENASKR